MSEENRKKSDILSLEVSACGMTHCEFEFLTFPDLVLLVSCLLSHRF